MWAAASEASLLDSDDQVILAIIAVLATSIAGLVYVVKAYGEAKQVNSAVNHKDTGELSLYRLADANTRKLDQVIAKQAEFDRTWGNLPNDLDNAVSLAETIHSINQTLASVQAELRQHVAWEMAQKYPKGDP